MRKRKKIIISIFSLIMCVLVTFAWINEVQNPEGRLLELEFRDAAVATSELDVKLFVNVQDDKFEPITKLYDEASPNGKLESYDNFAPGSRKKFKVDITNSSKTAVRLSVLLSEIICEDEELAGNVIIGTNGFAGFDANYPAPAVQNKLLSEGTDDAGTFILVDSVEIPPNKPVSIYFYVMFSAAGSENLEDKSFSIGKINFLAI